MTEPSHGSSDKAHPLGEPPKTTFELRRHAQRAVTTAAAIEQPANTPPLPGSLSICALCFIRVEFPVPLSASSASRLPKSSRFRGAEPASIAGLWELGSCLLVLAGDSWGVDPSEEYRPRSPGSSRNGGPFWEWSCGLEDVPSTMAMRGVDFKWYDGFFLSMLATSVIIVSINWKRYHLCTHPLHIWIVVDYTTVFIFRLLMFVDNGLAAGMGLDLGWQQRYARFCGRIAVLSVLILLLYPFLWVWTVIGTLWFTSARSCLPEEGQKWGFLIWLLFSYCGLICLACMSIGKWLTRRQAHLQRAQQGIPISEYGVLVDMVRVPDWAFEAAGQELRGMGQDTAYHPGLYLTATQREAVEALIQELPKFRLKAVPTDCSECPICLEEFRVGNEVRGLPCAHNFHVECIDQWLRLNVKCPRCRCSVFPNLDLSALSNLRADSGASEVTTATRYVRSQPVGQSYLLRLQGLLWPVRTENAFAGGGDDGGLAAAENGVLHAVVVSPASAIPVDAALPCVVADQPQLSHH